MTGVPLSVVIPARNEAGRIGAAVTRLNWADEIVVVDHDSRDLTAVEAESAGARVIAQPGGSIASARNAGAAAAKHDWILALDTDETAEPGLMDELARVLQSPQYDAYRIRRRNLYLGREQKRGAWGRDWIVRLYRRSQQYADLPVHEFVVTEGRVGELRSTLLHQPYRDLSHHLAKMDLYARLGAAALHAKGKRATALDLILRPRWRFIKAWLLNGQCLDGRFGLVTAQLGAETVRLKYQHLWALEQELNGRIRPDPSPKNE